MVTVFASGRLQIGIVANRQTAVIPGAGMPDTARLHRRDRAEVVTVQVAVTMREQ